MKKILCMIAFLLVAIGYGQINPTFELQQADVFADQGLIQGTVVAGDFDNDNDDDLSLTGVIATTSNTVVRSQFYTNNDSQYVINSSMSIQDVTDSDVAVADFDNDGDDDIIYGGRNLNGDVLEYLENLGGENFSSKGCNSLGPGMYSLSIAVGDVDNDGDLDVFISGIEDSDAVAMLLINDGNGCFSDSGQVFVGLPAGDSALVDIDNNGFLDLVYFGVLSQLPKTIVRMNTGGTFGPPVANNAGLPDLAAGGISAGMIDNNNSVDLLLSGSTGNKFGGIAFNNGNGIFNIDTQSLPQASFGSTDLADVDNDGDLDGLITGDIDNNSQNITKLLINDGNGNMSVSNQQFQGVFEGKAIFFDSDGDEFPEIFVLGNTGTGFPNNQPFAGFYKNLTGQVDSDGDGTPDVNDDEPNDPCIGGTPGEHDPTNPVWQNADCDNDGVRNADDECPETEPGTNVGTNGCMILGIDDNDFDTAITLYPNPASDRVFIDIADNSGITIQSIQGYNQLGQKILDIQGSADSIDISAYSTGIIFVHIISDDNSITVKKIIKQ